MDRASAVLGLSPREQEVTLCLCQHRSDKECAKALGISEATVHAHLKNIFKKLAVHDRNSAIHAFLERAPGG